MRAAATAPAPTGSSAAGRGFSQRLRAALRTGRRSDSQTALDSTEVPARGVREARSLSEIGASVSLGR